MTNERPPAGDSPGGTPPTDPPADGDSQGAPSADDWAEVAKQGSPGQVLELLRASRRWEDRAKENKAKADKWDEHEQSQQTEAERFTAELAAAKQRADEADARSLRLEVATSKGLTPAQAKRLVGATQEELEADADELLATFKVEGGDGEGDPGTGTNGRPRERTRPGGRPPATPQATPKEVADVVLARRGIG